MIILIGPQGFGNTQQYERDFAIIRQTRDPSFRIVPVILPGAPRPSDFLQILTWIDFCHVAKVSDAPAELERLVAAVQGGLTSSADAAREAICPYRGLDAFREEDSVFFFGRGTVEDAEGPIGQLVRKVRERPFVMVVGRSGSGKSSLVYAGLLPALRRQRDRFWNILTLRPGTEPLRALAAAFNPRADGVGAAEYAANVGREAEQLRSGDSELLSHMIREALDRSEGRPDRLLLYIDQWEELYAQAPSPGVHKDRAARHTADVNRFIDLLVDASESAPVSVVATVRADFYDPLIGHQKIRALLPTQQVLLGAMSRAELESTIVEPAKMVGLTFDPPQLVSRILDEAGDDEGMLPLLQYALKETFALREGTVMTAGSYARSGGVREAIRLTAERTFDELSSDDQQAARKLFLRLVTPGESQQDTRARAAMPDEPTLRRIVDKFASPRTRLLVTGLNRANQPTVEVAHEALIRTWPLLRRWVDATRDKLRTRAAILQAKAIWEENGRREDLLLPAGFQLERARTLVADPGDITVDDIKDLIAESEAADARRRAENELRERQRQAAEAGLGYQSRVLAMTAESIRVPAGYDGAADSLAMALLKPPHLPNVPEYIKLLYDGLGELRERRRIYTPDDLQKQVFAVSFAPGGKLLAAVVSSALLLYDADTGELVHSQTTKGGWVVSLRWSPDGKRIYVGTSPIGTIFSVCSIGKLRKYFEDCDDETSKSIVEIGSDEYQAGSGAWSRDGKWIVVAAWQRRVSLWDALNGDRKGVIGDEVAKSNLLDGMTCDIVASADGERIAMGTASRKIHIFKPSSAGKEAPTFKLEKSLAPIDANSVPYSLAFDPQDHDRLLAAYMPSPQMAVWEIGKGSPTVFAEYGSGTVWRAAFDTKGKFA